MSQHDVVYAAPELYDLGFSYRDYGRECAFLLAEHQRVAGWPPASFLELAAGPAGHALEMAARGLQAHALDLSPAMVAYAAGQASRRGLALDCRLGDMTGFEPPGQVDLAACMLCSATYLLEDRQVTSHLAAVAAALRPGGVYVLELPHPSELAGEEKTRDRWTVRDAGGELEVVWADSGGPSPVRDCQVRLCYRPDAPDAAPVVVEDSSRQRWFSRDDVERLVSASGVFTLDALYGALDAGVAIDAEKAWRMVAVLRSRR